MKLTHILATLLAGALIAMPTVAVLGAEVTDAEQAICEQQGGCLLITNDWLDRKLREATADGRAEGKAACLRKTTT